MTPEIAPLAPMVGIFEFQFVKRWTRPAATPQKNIEDKISNVAKPIFNIIPEDIKEPHVPEDVKESSMKKH
jgi:hypothetical protein